MPADPIIDDIFSNHRGFLPGEICTPDDVLKHFSDNILIDGLTREESKLVLSTLPRNSNRVYLGPLDKGLSEAKVYAGRYEINGTFSKPYVFKIGPLNKIDTECAAIEHLVRPYIQGIEVPILRRASAKGLVIQPLAGLSPNSSLHSLKDYARTSDPEIVTRLLCERLARWYDGPTDDAAVVRQSLAIIFAWYLAKVGDRDTFPADWRELKTWVKDSTGLAWGDVPEIITTLEKYELAFKPCIVHGDLHSQNVLIDEKNECWPIDFYWCKDTTTPLLDFTMLECSLKFLAIHRRSDLRNLIKIENTLIREPIPEIVLGEIPYRSEIQNVLRSILAIRKHAMDTMKLRFEDYRKALCLMTFVHSTHPLLNRPFVLASLQMQSAIEGESM